MSMRRLLVYALVAAVLWFPAVVGLFSTFFLIGQAVVDRELAGAVAAALAVAVSTAVAVPLAGLLRRQLAPDD